MMNFYPVFRLIRHNLTIGYLRWFPYFMIPRIPMFLFFEQFHFTRNIKLAWRTNVPGISEVHES